MSPTRPRIFTAGILFALRQTDKVYEYKTYAGESHDFLDHHNLQDQYQRIELFLD